jgi:DNA-binding CsgD family transcriptional regulator
VVLLAAEGKQNLEIAAILSISVQKAALISLLRIGPL